MEGNSPKLVYKVISLCIKGLIVAVACSYIYSKVFHRSDLDELQHVFSSALSARGVSMLLLVFAFMPLNWGIEAVKWKMLVESEEKLLFTESLRSVLSGVTISTITPNRAGEFAGRIFFLRKGNKANAALLSIAGSASQLFITLLASALGFCIFHFKDLELTDTAEKKYYLIVKFTAVFALICFIAAVLLAVFLIFLLRDAPHSKKKWIATLGILNRLGKKKMGAVMLLSLLRYLVFFGQFCLLFYLFDAGIGFKDMIILVPLTFFAVTVIPTVAFTELGIRGAAALLLFAPVTNNAAAVAGASFSLWLINVAFPALAGCFFVFRLHFFKAE